MIFMKKTIKYPYLCMLTISFLIVGAALKFGWIDLSKDTDMFSQQHTAHNDVDAPEESEPVSLETAENSSKPDPADPVSSDHISPEKPPVPEPPKEPAPPSKQPKVPVFYEADRSYFDDALFIGDSRTVGLYEYGDLGNAAVLADSGMSVYKIFQQSFRLSSGETVTLDSLLSEKQFSKIYIMLGINELGYSFDSTVKRYRDMVETVHTAQPDALIFLQANLHIAEQKSGSSDIYNNANINRFNEEVQALAKEKSYIYLDVNEIFDDENGNLADEYTTDQSHVLGKYYADWVTWLLQHAVTFE